MGLQSAHHPSHVSPFHGRKFSASKGQCNFRSAIFCNFHKCFHALKIGKSPPYLETAKVSWDIYPSLLPLEKFHLDTQPTLYTRRRTIIICEKGERKVWAGGQALPPCQKTLLQRAAQKKHFSRNFLLLPRHCRGGLFFFALGWRLVRFWIVMLRRWQAPPPPPPPPPLFRHRPLPCPALNYLSRRTPLRRVLCGNDGLAAGPFFFLSPLDALLALLFFHVREGGSLSVVPRAA